MKKLESTFLNMFLVLTLISVIAGAGLAAVYNVTKEPIEQANLKKQQEAIKNVLPEGAVVGEEVMVGECRIAKDMLFHIRSKLSHMSCAHAKTH